MRTNLRSQVRQTQLPKWKPLIPLFEAVMNSIQSIRDVQPPRKHGVIAIELHREPSLVEGEAPIASLTVTDNGVGLDDLNFDSFNTSYSDHKEKDGGKGLGRFTWLKAFRHVDIESRFDADGAPGTLRKFRFDERYDPELGVPLEDDGKAKGTIVRMVDFQEPYRSQFPRGADQIVQRLVEHFLLIFLQQDCPRISVIDGAKVYSVNDAFENDFKSTSKVHAFNIRGIPFTLHGFRLTTPRVANHKLVYAANERGVVSDMLKDYLPNLNARLGGQDGKGFVYLGVIQSPYLSQHVNPGRTDFDIGFEDADADGDLFAEENIKRAEIRGAALEFVQADLESVLQEINAGKERIIREFVRSDAPQYKVLLKHLPSFIDRISPSATKVEIETALHRELYSREVDMKREGARIIKEARKLDDYDGYQSRLATFMENYNEIGAAALAQYVAHRRIILDFLQQAIEANGDSKKYPLEKVVHQLVFPMRSTSEDISYCEQNLWMIDERLTFHSFVALCVVKTIGTVEGVV